MGCKFRGQGQDLLEELEFSRDILGSETWNPFSRAVDMLDAIRSGTATSNDFARTLMTIG